MITDKMCVNMLHLISTCRKLLNCFIPGRALFQFRVGNLVWTFCSKRCTVLSIFKGTSFADHEISYILFFKQLCDSYRTKITSFKSQTTSFEIYGEFERKKRKNRHAKLKTSFFLFKLDVYSYGVLFCEMCTRELPVPEKRAQQIRAVKNSDYRTLINNCLRRDVEKRFDSMAVLNVVDPWMTELLRTKEST